MIHDEMIIHLESMLYIRVLKLLFKLGFKYKAFEYNVEKQMYCIGAMSIAKTLPECLETLEWIADKANDT